MRQNKYINNPVEQGHHRIKRLVDPDLGFGFFNTAQRALKGYESMAMLRIKDKDDVTGQLSFVHEIFEIVV